ncbi:MAG TPA: ubiquinol-cytochrome c reductase iron-sulfur subunit [Burkholderiales bacterium]|nr:ubiquinol-cytochrome c reductase iron-sulfur subunit [Burkholderiales bacterium]
MSNPSEATLPSVAGVDEVDEARRKLLLATCIAGGAATGAATWPFLASMEPSERSKALGAPVEADISALAPGEQMIVEWQGKPVWVVHRTKEMMASLKQDEAELADPLSKRSDQPEYCDNEARARPERPEMLVVVGICTHLGCSPVARFTPGDPSMGAAWAGGFLCPCHGSRFDLSARVFRNFPAPDNLPVPRYMYLSGAKLLIGDDKA